METTTHPTTPAVGNDDRKLRDIRFAAEFIGLPVWKVYEIAARNEIPCKRIGQRLFFTREQLDRWLQAS